MREPRYSLLADIQYDIELARQGKFALYGQRNIAREYRCKKATPEEQQAYETLQNVLFMVPQWSDTEELHSDIVKLTNRDLRISFCLEKGLEVSSLQFFRSPAASWDGAVHPSCRKHSASLQRFFVIFAGMEWFHWLH